MAKKLPKVNTLADVVRQKRQSGASASESFFGGLKDKLREKTDWRQVLPQGGLLTAMFPNLKAYKAGPGQGDIDSISKTPSLAGLESSIGVVATNTEIAAKNTLVLPKIHQDINLMRQNIAKLVKLSGGKPVTKVDKDFFRSKDREAAYKVQSEKKEESVKPTPEGDTDKKGFFAGIAAAMKGAFEMVKESISGAISMISQAISNAVKGAFKLLKGMFKLANLIGTPLIRLLMMLFTTPIGLGILISAAVIYGLSKIVDKIGKAKIEKGDFFHKTQKVLTGHDLTPDSDKGEMRKLREENANGVGSNWFGRDKPFIKKWKDRVELGQEFSPEMAAELKRKYKIEVPQAQIKKESGAYENKNIIAIGDKFVGDIVAGQKDVDTALVKADAGPEQILSDIQNGTEKNPRLYENKKVLLAPGVSKVLDNDGDISNNNYLKIVGQQIEELTNASAKVTLIGTGRIKADAKLAKLAEEYGVQFKSPTLEKGQTASQLFESISGRAGLEGLKKTTGAAVDIKSREVASPPKPATAPVSAPVTPDSKESKKTQTDLGKAIASAYDPNAVVLFTNPAAKVD